MENYENDLILGVTQSLYVRDFLKDIAINNSQIRLRLSEEITENSFFHLKNAFMYRVAIYIHRSDQQTGYYQFMTEEIFHDTQSLIFHTNECDLFDQDKLSIWHKYNQNQLTTRYWLTLSRDQKQNWLEICYEKCVFNGFNLKVDSTHIISLDLSIINDELDFYCLLGEEVRGVLGYVGYNLDALEDFMSYNPNLTFNILNQQCLYNKNIQKEALTKINTIMEILDCCNTEKPRNKRGLFL